MGVFVPLNIAEVRNNPPVTNFCKTSGCKVSSPPTYQNLHHNTIIRNESTTNTVSHKKYLVALMKIVNLCHIFARKKLFQTFIFWFGEYMITLYCNLKKSGNNRGMDFFWFFS